MHSLIAALEKSKKNISKTGVVQTKHLSLDLTCWWWADIGYMYNVPIRWYL